MLRKLAWLPVLGLFLLPTAAHAQKYLDAGTWELTLSGTGSSNQDVDSGSFGIAGSLGYFVADQLEVGLRQTVAYSDFNAGTNVNASTSLLIDYHFDLGQWQPFIGASIGYTYGDVNDSWFAGPEGGIKYFVKPETFIYGLVQYQYFFDQGDGIINNFDDGAFAYSVGIGFTW